MACPPEYLLPLKPNPGRTCGCQCGNWCRNTVAVVAARALATVLLGIGVLAGAQEPPAAPAAALLHAKRAELQPQLRSSAFGEPVYLDSREGSDRIEGDVYAEVRQPFTSVGSIFRSATTVCELLFLHLNVRSCRPSAAANGEMLQLTVGPKRALGQGMLYRMNYALRVEVATADYLKATLSAAEGPLSTHDYRIVFEAVALDGGRAFVHFGYAYGYGTMARLAMKVYLSTAGRSKIGFTVLGQGTDGRPVYVRGERASLERNVIRYYLALLAYGSVTTGSPQEQMEARLRTWFALTERYAAQLHELDLDEYLHEKHDDLARTAGNPK